MLIDILNNSKMLANIIRSVTDNMVALGWVLYLFIITVVIYAQFGLESFQEAFSNGNDDGAGSCKSVIGCVIQIFYQGTVNLAPTLLNTGEGRQICFSPFRET